MAEQITTIHFIDGTSAIIALPAEDVANLIGAQEAGLVKLTTGNGHEIFVNRAHVAWVASSEDRRQDARTIPHGARAS